MSELSILRRTAFVTFYSFKGGVGRSMALINVAGILAGRGFKVMALDMDLEAPGISYLMRHESHRGDARLPGFVDLLSDASGRGEEADLFALTPQQVVERYSYPYSIPDEIRKSDEGCLRIMPAGLLDSHYQKRLDTLDLGRLYLEGQGQPLISAFKKVISDAEAFDFVFIDSRTGFSDESGICTRDLADHLVVVMGLNRQNQEGTAEFLRSLKGTGLAAKDLRIVLSPVPNGEDELVDKCEKQAAEILSKAWGQPLNLSLQIPYHPRLALTEEPHIFRRSRGYLYDAYARIERAVLVLMGLGPDKIQKQIEADAEKNRSGDVLLGLRMLAKLDRGPERIASLSPRLLKLLGTPDAEPMAKFIAAILPPESWYLSKCAISLHEEKNDFAELFYQRLVANDPKNADQLGNYATFLTDIRKDHGRAEEFYKRAIEANPTHANNLTNYGMLLKESPKEHDRAEEFYKRAIEADPTHANSLGNYAIFLHDIRKDHDRAEEFYKRAIEADPTHANNLGNYSKLLFLLGRSAEAEAMIQRAWDAKPDIDSLRCELHFYAYAHAWQRHTEALSSLKHLLESGARSEGWPLDENVRAAVESGHPHPDFLKTLANVLSSKAAVETLPLFDCWTSANGS